MASNDPVKALVTVLEAYRAAHGLSIERLAEKVGLSKSSMWNIMKGRSIPRVDTVMLISQQVGIPLHQLLGESAYPQDGVAAAASALMLTSIPVYNVDSMAKLCLVIMRDNAELNLDLPASTQPQRGTGQ